jgi:hypothetical protein
MYANVWTPGALVLAMGDVNDRARVCCSLPRALVQHRRLEGITECGPPRRSRLLLYDYEESF